MNMTGKQADYIEALAADLGLGSGSRQQILTAVARASGLGGRSFAKTATAEEASAVIEWALAQLGRTKAEAS
jgi:hypothetical protein